MKEKVLLISHELTYTGAPRSLLNIALVLRKLGFDVKVCSLLEGEFRAEFERAGFPVETQIPGADRLVREGFGLVICNTIFTAETAWQMQDRLPVILYVREGQSIPYILQGCGIEEAHFLGIHNIVCVSEYVQNFMRETYHLSHTRVIHNFVRNQHRFRWNRPREDEVHFLLAGTIEYRKGYDVALKALESMRSDLLEKTYLHIAGRKPEWSEEYWEGLQLEQRFHVVYHGEIQNEEEKWKLFEKMNVFLVPSRDEPCSLTALEGAMLGKALILSDNVGASYLIRGKNGWIYKNYDVQGLCGIMENFVRRRNLLWLRGMVSYCNYLGTSTEKIYTKKLEKVIEEVME